MRLNKLYLLPEYHGRGYGAFAGTRQGRRRRLCVREIYLYVPEERKAVRAYRRAVSSVRAEVTEAGDGYYYDDT